LGEVPQAFFLVHAETSGCTTLVLGLLRPPSVPLTRFISILRITCQTATRRLRYETQIGLQQCLWSTEQRESSLKQTEAKKESFELWDRHCDETGRQDPLSRGGKMSPITTYRDAYTCDGGLVGSVERPKRPSASPSLTDRAQTGAQADRKRKNLPGLSAFERRFYHRVSQSSHTKKPGKVPRV